MRGFSVSFLLFVTAAVAQRGPPPKRYTLNVGNERINTDGFRRPAITINHKMPGQLLTANKGQDLLVRVNNRLTDHDMRVSTTIHWHGILQPRTAYDDGPAGVTQCPIAPGHSYTYRIETSDQAGTFWYHSHLSSQYVDGLRGPLIIYDRKNDPHRRLYDVDDKNTIISLTDWYHKSANILGKQWEHNEIPEPVPDSNLFNGVGRYAGGPRVERPVMFVRRGRRYRFRLINMSAIVPFNFSIEGHSLTVIEADGVDHQPLKVSSLSISAGQRYSVVLNANQRVGNYWITYPSNFRETRIPDVNPNYNGTEAFAVLRYFGAPRREPRTPQPAPDMSNPLVEYKLKPLVSPPPPTDTPMVVPLKFEPTDGGTPINQPGGGNKWTMNNVSYTSPSVMTLLQILSGQGNQSASLPPDVIVLPINRTIDVQLIGDPHHPFHLHGHTFQVIQSAEGPRNEINPPIRDTVDTNDNTDPTANVPPVTLRFRTDNPGPWFLHCHKDWHLEAGLAVVFAEDPEGMQRGPKSIRPPNAWRQLCKIYNALSDADK